MKLTRKTEKEVRQVYTAYWDNYFRGKVRAFASLLDDQFRLIGTSESEIIHNKAEAMRWFKAQTKEIVGKGELKKRKITLSALDGLVLVSEQSDLYILSGGKWKFYSKLRITTFFRNTPKGWKLVQQHGSVPDTRPAAGETVSFEDLSKENLKLRDEVKRRTAELEIEAALERVRSRSMSMHKSEELASVASVLFHQLQELDIPALRRCLIGIVDESKGSLQSWYTSMHGDSSHKIITYPLSGPRFIESKIKGWRKQKPFTIKLTGAALKEFVGYAERHGFRRSKGERAPTSMIQHHAPFRYGYLEVATHEPISDQDFNLLQRFAKVFEQTYTRFLDLQKAEAQAREAQIEAALERLRSRSMAMHQSEELGEVVLKLFEGLDSLGFDTSVCNLSLVDNKTRTSKTWTAHRTDKGISTYVVSIPFLNSPFYKAIIKAFNDQVPFSVSRLSGKNLINHTRELFEKTDYSHVPEDVKEANKKLPASKEPVVVSYTTMKYGLLLASRASALNHEEAAILQRFAKVFEQTYTRFLDLQKAEAQAREAQIEAALERVRARSLAMHHSEELLDIIIVVSEQLQQLNIKFANVAFGVNSSDYDMRLWMAVKSYPKAYHIQWTFLDNPGVTKLKEAQQNPGKVYTDVLTMAENNEWLEHIFRCNPGLDIFSKKSQEYLLNTPGYARSVAIMKDIFLVMGNYAAIPYTHEENSIFKRFANVFEQSYTRFLDLKNAEAQARESEIQLGLERVRARTMAMHKSEELNDVVMTLFEQVTGLKIDINGININIVNESITGFDSWFTAAGYKKALCMYTPYFDHPVMNDIFDAIKNNKHLLNRIYSKKIKNSYFTYLYKHTDYRNFPDERKKMILGAQNWCLSVGMENNIGISIHNYSGKSFSDEDHDILQRFAKVFNQSYTRFLDLQKAEAQVREAQIEAALEKVRSRSLAMHKSDELQDVVNTVFERLKALEIDMNVASIFIFKEGSKDWEQWVATSTTSYSTHFHIPYNNLAVFRDLEEARQAGKDFFSVRYSFEQKNEWFRYAFEHTDYRQIPEERKKYLLESEFFLVSFALSRHSGIQIAKYEGRDFSAEENEILKRFNRVFEQAYIRFLDLKKAESQAREAQIEAGLERVRSCSLSMESTEDLQQVVDMVFVELNKLEIGMDHTAIVTLIDDSKDYNVWVGSADANFTTVSRIPYNSLTQVQRDYNEMIENRPTLLSKTYTGEIKREYSRYLFSQTGFKNNTPEKELRLMMDGDSLITSIVMLENTGIQIVSYQNHHFSENDEKILSRFTNVFEQAYIRFMDIRKAEEQAAVIKREKERLEKTLSDLQATQKQLIQSEKMASLGELTAGIAHEIQNPLNFVNNFSEVSGELIDEMKAELAKDNGDVQAIIEDLRQNLEKINHHGKRADGIVKGMLMHSRAGTGKKELTDINMLCDEYLRLSYHGFRAKDKSFNAKYETRFDAGIEKINVVPQEIGRVILNLINNAFYACAERSRSAEAERRILSEAEGSGSTVNEKYEPAVIVSTMKMEDKVEVKVEDNGNGIPDSIKEKIFQPFFTTKPTGQGTGLGLSLSYDIIKAHGGDIRLETKPGEGSVFTMIIPLT